MSACRENATPPRRLPAQLNAIEVWSCREKRWRRWRGEGTQAAACVLLNALFTTEGTQSAVATGVTGEAMRSWSHSPATEMRSAP